MKVDAHRPKAQRRTAKLLFAQLQSQGYGGGYSRVTDFIRAWRENEGRAVLTQAFVPLTFELGEAFQFDWSEEGLTVGDVYYRAQVVHLEAVRQPCVLAGGLSVARSQDAVPRQPAHPIQPTPNARWWAG